MMLILRVAVFTLCTVSIATCSRQEKDHTVLPHEEEDHTELLQLQSGTVEESQHSQTMLLKSMEDRRKRTVKNTVPKSQMLERSEQSQQGANDTVKNEELSLSAEQSGESNELIFAQDAKNPLVHVDEPSAPYKVPSDPRYDQHHKCPLESNKERASLAFDIGGTLFAILSFQFAFRAWMWSDGEGRAINPATDPDLQEKGPLLATITPTWADIGNALAVFVIERSIVLTDGNLSKWFMNSASMTCWEPAPLVDGFMVFKHDIVADRVCDPNQKRGYYIRTSPQNPTFFAKDTLLFLDGAKHQSLRRIMDMAGFARRYEVDFASVRMAPVLGLDEEPEETTISSDLAQPLSKAIWGATPPGSVLDALQDYAKYGKFSFFGDPIHSLVLKHVGISTKIYDSAKAYAQWAQTTELPKYVAAALDAHAPGNPFFLDFSNVIENLVTATLFAGLVGTTDLVKKCVAFQKRDDRMVQLFRENPERFLIELMRYNSAVTSVTEVLDEDQEVVINGRKLTFAKGTPVQVVLTTANRDPTFWQRPTDFDPSRPDLGETLSWNGRARDAERRNYEAAPRHCPGYCLSLKLGAALCAQYMGFLEELEEEGKLSSTVSCSTFNPPSEADLWEPPVNTSRM